jgi:hypothetical protein
MDHPFGDFEWKGAWFKKLQLYSKNKVPMRHTSKRRFSNTEAYSIQLHSIGLYIFQLFRRKSGMEFECLYETGNSRYIAFKLGIREETPEGY